MSTNPHGPTGSVFPASIQPPDCGGAPRTCEAGAAPAAAKTPRLVIRGETENQIAFIDWLSFTASEGDVGGVPGALSLLRKTLETPDVTGLERERGIAGFSRSAAVHVDVDGEPQQIGLLAWGGQSQRGKFLVSLSGVACSKIATWEFVSHYLEKINATITRTDLAHDDLIGKKSITDVLNDYHEGAFNAGGRQPKCKPAGDWIGDGSEGRTLEIGRRGSGKFCRVYEKGRQLGDSYSPWLRMEVEILRKDRWIPYDILTDPDRYLAGSYPAFQFISSNPTRIKTNRRAAQATLDHLIRHASIACGKTINAMSKQGFNAAEIVSQLQRPGIPRRLRPAVAALPADAQYAYGDHEND